MGDARAWQLLAFVEDLGKSVLLEGGFDAVRLEFEDFRDTTTIAVAADFMASSYGKPTVHYFIKVNYY